MGLKQKDIGDLGPLAILCESVKLFANHTKSFVLIQLSFILPAAILAAGVISYYQKEIFPPASENLFEFHNRFSISSSYASLVQSVGINFFLQILAQAVDALGICGTFYAVGLIYAGKNFSFLDVLRHIPCLWKRIIVTDLYYVLIGYGILVLYMVISFLAITRFHSAASFLFLFGTVIHFVLAAALQIIFQLAQAVSILEKTYGWAAFRKGAKLLHGKIWISIGVMLLTGLLGVIPISLLYILQARVSSWSPIVSVLVALFYLVSSTMISQVDILASGVSYVSFMAFHREGSIADFGILKRVATKEGYERLERDDSSITGDKQSVNGLV